MWLRALLVGAFFAGLLSACAVIDPVDSRYDTVSRSLAKARNEAIFLNLVRASHDYPLAFTTVANVTPGMTNTTSFALPAFVLGNGNAGAALGGSTSPGRDFIFGNTTASNATAVSTNFNISTEETGAFYDGFLKPIGLDIADYFIRQGYSRELLFWLFADSVEVDIPGRPPLGTRYSPPGDLGCNRYDPKKRCFSDYVLMAIGAGLTVEEKTVQKASSSAKGGGGGSDSGGAKTETTVYSRFCFDPVLAQQAQAAMGSKWIDIRAKLDLPVSAFNPKCGSTWEPQKDASKPQPDYSPFNVGPIKFKIKSRSAYGVFEFLGNLMKIEEGMDSSPDNVPPDQADEQTPLPYLYTVPDDRAIIRVSKGSTAALCFAHTWFYDGDYCVPETATTTKRIFSLLAQLIAIQTSTTDLSITPIVRVIQ